MRGLAPLALLVGALLAAPGRCDDDPFAGLVLDGSEEALDESATRGLRRAGSELGVAVLVLDPPRPAERLGRLKELCDRKCRVVVASGFMYSDLLVAHAWRHPEIRFAGLDLNAMAAGDFPPNLVGLRFRVEEGSFLVGAIAGLVSRSKKVGFVGGMDVPLIQAYQAGFTAGVKHVAPEAEVFVAFAGDTPAAFMDPVRGRSIASGMYAQGADVLYHASGATGEGVFEAAREAGPGRYVIGVDSDQGDEAPGHVLTSMVKRYDVAAFEAIRSVQAGTFRSGMRELGLAEDGVGFVLDERNRDLVPDEVRARVAALRDEIVAGRLRVPTAR